MNSKNKNIIITTIIAVCLVLAIGIGIGLNYHAHQQSRQPEKHSPKITVSQFIKKIAPTAQAEQKKYHIPASIIIAQAGTESDWGRSKLAYKYNNLFGIKATSKKHRVRMYTKENINGKTVEVKQYFATYQSWAESMNAHAKLLANNSQFKKVLTAKNYQAAAQALQDGGYATDPNYASELIYAIKKFNLDQYDQK